MTQAFDVAIVGGGFGGLTLARDLILHVPDIRVVVIEKKKEFATPKHHKVGETSLVPQAIYLAERLQLKEYLEQHHLEKFGARYFFKNHKHEFESRPEMGANSYGGAPEYQMDRTRLEADLFSMNQQDGVEFLLDTQVLNLELSIDENPHVLQLEQDGDAVELKADWVIDASGRRRLLPSSLGQKKGGKGPCSAAWMRVEGWIDIDSFASSSQSDWHDRIDSTHPRAQDFRRIYSTNHLVGEGYWVWLIPLTDDVMSIGIVSHEEHVPFEQLNQKEKALHWLSEHEPHLAEQLREKTITQFRVMRNYSYAPAQFVSENQWFCIGESLGFADPLYASSGMMMTVQNLLAVETIQRYKREEHLDGERVQAMNAYVSSHLGITTEQLHSLYPLFGYSRIAASHILWDMASLVSFHRTVIPKFDEGIYDFLSSKTSSQLLVQLHELNQSINHSLTKWARSTSTPQQSRYLSDCQMFNQYTGVRSLMMSGMMQPMVMMVFGLGYLLCLLGFKSSGTKLLAHSYMQSLRRISKGLQGYIRAMTSTPDGQSPRLSGMARPWGRLLGTK